MLRAVIVLTASVLNASCSSESVTDTPSPLEQFAAVYDNTFETPKTGDSPIIRDRRVRIASDNLAGVWFYSQMNTGEDFKLYRQRIFNFIERGDGQGIVQKTYVLNQPEIYANAWDNPELLATLTQDDFKPMFDMGCDTAWTETGDGAWTGYVDPQRCIIDSTRRNMKIRIESESVLSSDKYQTTERGYDIDMNFLWGSKPGEMNTLLAVEN